MRKPEQTRQPIGEAVEVNRSNQRLALAVQCRTSYGKNDRLSASNRFGDELEGSEPSPQFLTQPSGS